MCREGRAWVGAKDIYAAWDTCPRGDWMLQMASAVDAGRPAVIAILDLLQTHLCCIRADIPAALLALPEIERLSVLQRTAQWVRSQISSGEIARKLGL